MPEMFSVHRMLEAKNCIVKRHFYLLHFSSLYYLQCFNQGFSLIPPLLAEHRFPNLGIRQPLHRRVTDAKQAVAQQQTHVAANVRYEVVYRTIH